MNRAERHLEAAAFQHAMNRYQGRLPGQSPYEPPSVPIRRILGSLVLSSRFLFPSEIVQKHEGALEKAEKLLSEGYGLITIFNHWSKRDPAEVIKALTSLLPHALFVDMHAPVGKHQWKFYIAAISEFWGVAASPITTPDTLREWRRQKPPRLVNKDEAEKEYQAYLQTAAEILELGGILFVAPQAGRKSRMTAFPGDPIGSIVYFTREQGFEKIAFLPIGIGEKGRTDYSASGFNFGHTYTLSIGECMALSEIEEELTQRNQSINQQRSQQPNLRLITVDNVIYEQLNTVVPDAYKRVT